MATAQKTQSNVALFMSNEASPEVFTEVDGLTSIQGPDGSASEIDTTDLNATARTFLIGLPDSGSIQCSGFYDGDDTQHALLYTRWSTAAQNSFQLKFQTESPNEVWAFEAFVTNFSLGSDVDQAVTFSFTLRITGAITKTG